MKRVLFDSDVLLDVLAQRQPFFFLSAKALDTVTQRQVQGYVSGHAITNIFYILRRQRGIFGLYITDTAIGATVLVGVVLLVGIVVNNAIVMVELANQLYQIGKGSRQAVIIKAASTRLRPILMTTITTVLGMFPLAIGIGEGSEFLQPLGIVVFSGLVFATLLTLFIIPCFYVLLHQKSLD